MLLNQTLVIIKKKIVDIPLIVKYIQDNKRIDDAFKLYNDAIGHRSFGRFKLTKPEFEEMWRYLK